MGGEGKGRRRNGEEEEEEEEEEKMTSMIFCLAMAEFRSVKKKD